MKRTNETARIIAEELGYTGEIIVDARLKERMVNAEYEGRLWSEIKEIYTEKFGTLNIPTGLHMLSVLGGAETDETINLRIKEAYEDISTKYAGKRVLIVAHGNVFRSFVHHVMGVPLERVMTDRNYRIQNNELIRLPSSPLQNPLDRWVYGELTTLVGKVQDAFERYDLQTAAASLVSFMDDLTNWYVRRSRRRFWKSENDGDKTQAYETLYHVLTTLCKVAAPMIPFVTESVYRGLTGRESVHLDMFPSFERTHVSTHLLADMKKTKEFVTLGLALRSSKKIRVRQPLQSVTIGETLDPYFVEILKEELNVKEVIVGDMSSVARQICRPDAKILGPRIGKAVQEVIREAKSGNFTILPTGQVQVGEYTLETNEFTLAYEPLVEGSDVEGNGGLVIMMDSIITEELRLEGVARDVIRMIQDMRKEAEYQVTDRIRLALRGDEAPKLSGFIHLIQDETLAEAVSLESLTNPEMTRILEGEGNALEIQIQRV